MCSDVDPKATEDCKICEEAVKKFGHEADFQSVGRKGSNVVLTEMGEDVRDMTAPVQIAMIKVFPNWKLASRKSQIQELFEDRGHFFLVGAACHAELASKEHGWERLKRGVKPWVDGTLTTLQSLIAKVLPTITQRERLLDNARCRRVMKAYRTLAERGESANADSLQLWEREHSKHRDVHVGELAALQREANIAVSSRHAAVEKKMMSEAEMKAYADVFWANARKKFKSYKKSFYNRKYLKQDRDSKLKTKARKDKYAARVVAGLVHKDSAHVVQHRRF